MSISARNLLTPTFLLTLGVFLLIALRPAESSALGLILTIAGVILAGKMAKSGLDDTVDDAKDDAKDVINHASEQISALVEQLEETYAGALETSLDSLDDFSGKQLLKLAGFFDQINQKLMQDWSVVQGDVLQLLKQVDGTIQKTMIGLEDLVVVGVRGATFVIDKTTYNAAFLLAVVLTAVGLLLFARLLWAVKGPRGGVRVGAFALMGTYVVFSASLLLPQPRAYAIKMAGQAQELRSLGSGPHLYTVTPATLVVGEPAELLLVGAHFDVGGAPTVRVGKHTLVPESWSETHVAVRLSADHVRGAGDLAVSVRTADGGTSEGLQVAVRRAPTPTMILSWRLTATGERYGLFTSTTSRKLSFSCKHSAPPPPLTIELDRGWVLDRERQASFERSWGAPELRVGFTEAPRGKTAATRFVRALPSDRGIAVSAVCKRTHFLSTETFEAAYVVHGRRLVTGTGAPISGGEVAPTAAGLVTLATYPARELALFKDREPDFYSLQLQLRAADGEKVDRTFVFTPGSPTPVEFEELSLWLENASVKVKRRGGPVKEPSLRGPRVLAQMGRVVDRTPRRAAMRPAPR